jgi:hypothetical protein
VITTLQNVVMAAIVADVVKVIPKLVSSNLNKKQKIRRLIFVVKYNK